MVTFPSILLHMDIERGRAEERRVPDFIWIVVALNQSLNQNLASSEEWNKVPQGKVIIWQRVPPGHAQGTKSPRPGWE